MILKKIELNNFRNYDNLSLELDQNINIIYGNNGEGKTNILESIYLLGVSKSHRVNKDSILIKENCDYSKICGEIEKNNISTKLEIILNKNNKTLIVDNNKVKKISQFITNFNVVIFFPEDLDMIKGAPSLRRKYINIELSQLNSTYCNVLSDYNKLLKMRNDYLKNNTYFFDYTYFNILTDYFIDKALLIYKMRRIFVEKLNEISSDIYNDIMNIKNFNIKYEFFNEKDYDFTKESMKKYAESILQKEKNSFITLFGPHLDDLGFYIGDNEMIKYASQGQQRGAILSIKMAEIKLFENITNEKPVLLLDDVFSELDLNKRNNLIKYISDDIQVIITSTDSNIVNYDLINRAKLIEINKGKIVNVREVIK